MHRIPAPLSKLTRRHSAAHAERAERVSRRARLPSTEANLVAPDSAYSYQPDGEIERAGRTDGRAVGGDGRAVRDDTRGGNPSMWSNRLSYSRDRWDNVRPNPTAAGHVLHRHFPAHPPPLAFHSPARLALEHGHPSLSLSLALSRSLSLALSSFLLSLSLLCFHSSHG